MKVLIDKTFSKDVRKIKDKKIHFLLANKIEELQKTKQRNTIYKKVP